MGEIVGAAVLSHIPTIVMDEAARRRMGGGADTTLVEGLARVRAAMDEFEPTTLAIVDTHWFSLTGHVLAGADRYRGTYTSGELPRVIADYSYDYPGSPELAALIHARAKAAGVPTTNATNRSLTPEYPTLNLQRHLLRGEKTLSLSTCQTATLDDFLAFGEVVAEAVAESDERVMFIGGGALSHRFWPLMELPDHMGFDPSEIVTPEAREMDERIIALWERGDHAAVLDMYPEFLTAAPEGRFGHYLILAGLFGGRRWRSPGRAMSAYESSLGTGEVHMMFDLSQGVPDGGEA